MRLYERLYAGERAKKHRYKILQSLRHEEAAGYYVLTPPANGKNLLDMYPAFVLKQPDYKEQDLLILGSAEDFEDAAELAGRIVSEVYEKTGGFDVQSYLKGKLIRE